MRIALRPFLLPICIGVSAFAAAQEKNYNLPATPTNTPPKIDGVIEPNEYPTDARREGFSDLDTNLAADEPAEFWLTYDSQYIYFAGRVKTDPRKVVRDEYRPNASLRGNDNMSLQIDPFNTGRGSNQFGTNANGATSISLSGGRAAKTEWIGEIEANGRLTETGWECEMRVPWSIITLPGSGTRDVAFNVYWFRSNKQNTYAYRFINDDNSLTPKWQGVNLPAVSNAKTLSLLPYVYVGAQEGTEPIANAGLDLKTNLTDRIQLVGTINPDFRNIENAILSLDFSYFERLADENRPFFLEGANYRRTGFDARMFAPQRIRTFDAGLNIYGELDDKTTISALSTIDVGERQTFVGSATHRFHPNHSLQGAIVKNEQTGLNNLAGHLTYSGRTNNYSYFLSNQYTSDQVRGAGYRNNVGGNYSHAGLTAGFEYIQIGPDFFPRIGFVAETDLKGFQGFAEKEVTPSSGPINSYSFNAFALSYDRFKGGFYRNTMNLNANINLKSGIGFGVGTGFSNFLGTADHELGVGIGYPIFDPYRGVGFEYGEGTFQGIAFQSYDFDWRYRPLQKLQLNGRSQFQLSDQDSTQHVFSLNYDIGKFESIGGRLVIEDGQSNWFLSYRLSGKRGAEYFLLIGDPRAETFTDRLILKAVVPLTIKF